MTNCQIIKVAIIKILNKYDTALSSLTYYTQFQPNASQNRQVITNKQYYAINVLITLCSTL